MRLKPYEDPAHENNSAHHHTGKHCVEAGCDKPAGTAWSPLWCQACNAKRIRRIDNSLRKLTQRSSRHDLVSSLSALIKKSGGSVRLHRPGGVHGQAADGEGPATDN